MKALKTTLRIIALPFVLILATISCIYHIGKMCVNFVKYGGELIAYPKDPKKIHHVYGMLETFIDNQKDLDPEFNDIVNDNFEDLIQTVKNNGDNNG